MVRRRVEIEYPDDAELGQSRQDDGASSPNFYVSDYKGVRGQVKIYDIDEDEEEPSYEEPVYDDPDRRRATEPLYDQPDSPGVERDPFAEAISDALAQVMKHYINLGVAKAAPHVKAWMADKALPAVKSIAHTVQSKLSKRREARRGAGPSVSADSTAIGPAEKSPELDVELMEGQPHMTTQEAQARVAAALLARAFSEEQLSRVFNARVDDDGQFLAWMKSMEERSPTEIEDRIHVMIESNPRFLEEFFATLLGARHADNHPEVSVRRGGARVTPGRGRGLILQLHRGKGALRDCCTRGARQLGEPHGGRKGVASDMPQSPRSRRVAVRLSPDRAPQLPDWGNRNPHRRLPPTVLG